MTNETNEPTYFEWVLNQLPANKSRWPKTSLLTLSQALCLSYGIEPPKDRDAVHPLCANYDYFLSAIDVHSISVLTDDAIRAGHLQYQDRYFIKAEDFVTWAKDNKIPIKEEFFYRPPQKTAIPADPLGEVQNTTRPSIGELPASCMDDLGGRDGKIHSESTNGTSTAVAASTACNPAEIAAQKESQKDKENEKSPRRDRPETLRKNIVRNLVQLYWRYEEKKQIKDGKSEIKYTKPSELARKKEIKTLIGSINKICGLIPDEDKTEGYIDPDWYSDLYPGKDKPGPRSKK